LIAVIGGIGSGDATAGLFGPYLMGIATIVGVQLNIPAQIVYYPNSRMACKITV
jgi:hypothetical protein